MINLVSLLIYLGEDVVCNFINCMIEESKYCIEVMKKTFNKELVMTIKDNEDFKISANVRFSEICYAGSVIIIILTVMLKEEIIVISYENIETMHKRL